MDEKDDQGRIIKPDENTEWGHSVCNRCGRDMPACWDTVCFDCGRTFGYECSVGIGDNWYCIEHGKLHIESGK